MPEILPFRALRFDCARAGAWETLCSPPYDIVSPEERRELLSRNPYNIIRLEKPAEGSGDTQAPYEQAAATLADWKGKGVLRTDMTAAFWGLEMSFVIAGETRTITGFLARVKLHEFADKVILPHEETLSGDKADRLSLLTHTGVQFSPLMGFVSGAELPLPGRQGLEADFTMPDGVSHKMWRIDDPGDVETLKEIVASRQLLIADGHHRYETMLRYSRTLPEASAGKYAMFAILSMEQPGLTLFGTHRLLTLPVDEVDTKVAAVCEMAEVPSHRSLGEDIGLFYRGKTYRLQLKTPVSVPGKSDAYNSLIVTQLHSGILQPAFGVTPEQVAAGSALRYTRSTEEAIAKVTGGQATAAFLLPPTLVSQMRDVSWAHEKMPQKSTYFYPKLITGLAMNDLSVRP